MSESPSSSRGRNVMTDVAIFGILRLPRRLRLLAMTNCYFYIFSIRAAAAIMAALSVE